MNENKRFRKAQILNDVVQLWRNGQAIRSIAREVGLSRYAVARMLEAHQRGAPSAAGDAPASLGRPPHPRASKLDAYEPQLKQLLERYPRITAKRLFEELQRVDVGHPLQREVDAEIHQRDLRMSCGKAASDIG